MYKKHIKNKQTINIAQEKSSDVVVLPYRSKYHMSASMVIFYIIVGVVFLIIGIWLGNDLISSRSVIFAQQSALAVQTSGFISQRFANTITATDYVLRDITTKVTADEINTASSNQAVQEQLSALSRDKLATLPNVYGLGFLDSRCVFVAAADEHLIGIQSNSKLHVTDSRTLKNQTYVEYVPTAKSANKQPAILISRPIFSSNGSFIGGTLAAIMLTSAQDWIETFHIGVYDTISMVDENGILIATNPSSPDRIGKQILNGSEPLNISSQGDSTSFVAALETDGRERIYGFSKVESVPLYLIVGFDTKVALREWQQRLWQVTAGYLVLMVLVTLLLRKNFDVLAQRDEMQILSITDPLTGIANRRQLMLSGEKEITRAIRYHVNSSVLMVDIDHFKSINDTWGHPTGDRVIQFIARAMVINLRTTDLVGRIGGEEFAVVMPETDIESASVSAQRLRQFIESTSDVKSDSGSQVCFTVSIGIAGINKGDTSFDDILARADKALIAAKNQGRNRVVLA